LRRKPAPPGFAAKVFERIESEALNKKTPRSFLRSWARGAFRQEILAFASAVMLILGVVMQLGGDQSVLADSIERLEVMITVSAGLYRVTSMDCTVLKPGAGGENSQYRVRWNAAGVTRVDMDSTNGTERTLWISKGTVSVADYEGGAVRSTAIATMPSKWQPPMEFLTPTILAQHMEERYGLMQAGRQDGAGPDEFQLVGQENQQVIEIAIDARTYLPTTLKKYLPDSGRTGKERDCLEEVRFQWNKPIPQELLVPGSSAVKRQVN
jgi:hypothetical protein